MVTLIPIATMAIKTASPPRVTPTISPVFGAGSVGVGVGDAFKAAIPDTPKAASSAGLDAIARVAALYALTSPAVKENVTTPSTTVAEIPARLAPVR